MSARARAGGGVVAGELADRGRSVLLLEAGPRRTAADFTRWEAYANHDIWWPLRFAPIDGGARGVVALLAARCVGGTTTINTKVALRVAGHDYAKWHAGGAASSEPAGRRSARPTSIRTTNASSSGSACACGPTGAKSVYTVEPGFRALGSHLEPVHAYTDANCMSCGSCLQGCPTNAGKSTMNTYIHDAWATGKLELPRRRPGATSASWKREGRRTGSRVPRRRRLGPACRGGRRGRRRRDAQHAAASQRSGLPDTASTRLVGRNLGFHPVRLVYGLFDEPQDAHMVYPITAHAMGHQHDEDGGFVVEATTIQDPIGFATTLEDENGPLWGTALVETVKRFRHWVGLLVMVNDDNNGSVQVGENGEESFDAAFTAAERERIDGALDFTRDVLRAAGASSVRWTGLLTTHVQGTCRMGSDPERSVVDADGQSWDVKRLYVGDGSLVPRTLSVNPSLTIMALADRLADHLHGEPARLPPRRRDRLAVADDRPRAAHDVSSPSRRTAFSFRINGRTSGLMLSASKSASQRSGVMNG